MACIRKAPMKSMIFAVRVYFGEIFVPVAHCAKQCVCGRKDVGVKAERDGWISVTRKSDGGGDYEYSLQNFVSKIVRFCLFRVAGRALLVLRGPVWCAKNDRARRCFVNVRPLWLFRNAKVCRFLMLVFRQKCTRFNALRVLLGHNGALVGM